jgi:hypothetical protein
MHQRIKELWEQAVHDDGSNTSVIEVFAELIVRECALQVREQDDADRIFKNFGVEE